ncbi:MAG: sulfatase [Myxococcales bacterium]|nr:sulfatase [Myxococcales bacterium]
MTPRSSAADGCPTLSATRRAWAWLAWLLAACSTSSGAEPVRTSSGAATGAEASSPKDVAGAPTAAPSASSPASAVPPARQPLNVLLVTVDSMRADMPWAGYARDIAPNLTKLARESIVYDRAYTVSSYTAKSVAAFLTGRYPSTLYRDGAFFTAYAPGNVFFTELLQSAGVRTLGAHAHAYFDRGKNLNQGFDVWRMVPGIKFNATTDESVTGDKLTDLAVEMLGDAKNTGGPFFLWLHYMDPHDVYKKHKESPDFGSKGRDLYDNEMFYTDLQIERLLAFCRQQAWWPRTAVVVSADHGEGFGEHKNYYRHGFALWEVVTHVPWFFHLPDQAPRRVTERRSHIDLAPTVLELMGQSPDVPGIQGRSLAPELIGGAPPDDREPILLDLPADSHNPPARAILKGRYKLVVDIDDRRFALYDLDEDPGETKDIAKAEPAALAEMKAAFESAWAKVPRIHPYGGNKLKGGGAADGPQGPDEPGKGASDAKKKAPKKPAKDG